jgi:hypothetical protein
LFIQNGAKTRGYRGVQSSSPQLLIQKEQKRGVIGVQSSSPQSLIQKGQKRGVIRVKISSPQSFIQKKQKQEIAISLSQSLIQKRAKTRDHKQFIAIAHSKKSKNKRSRFAIIPDNRR